MEKSMPQSDLAHSQALKVGHEGGRRRTCINVTEYCVWGGGGGAANGHWAQTEHCHFTSTPPRRYITLTAGPIK